MIGSFKKHKDTYSKLCVTPWTLGLIALPTESPGGGFDYDRINVFFFYDMILHQAGMHVRGMYC